MVRPIVEAGKDLARAAYENPEKSAAVIGGLAVTGVMLDATLRGPITHFRDNILSMMKREQGPEIEDDKQEIHQD